QHEREVREAGSRRREPVRRSRRLQSGARHRRRRVSIGARAAKGPAVNNTLIALAVITLATAPRAYAQSAADVEAGKQLFNGMCVECHGAGGAGGDAPSLNRPRLLHAPTDAALIAILTNGIPNTAMPRIRRFTDNEMQQLVAYVRSIGKVTEEKVP